MLTKDCSGVLVIVIMHLMRGKVLPCSGGVQSVRHTFSDFIDTSLFYVSLRLNGISAPQRSIGVFRDSLTDA